MKTIKTFFISYWIATKIKYINLMVIMCEFLSQSILMENYEDISY